MTLNSILYLHLFRTSGEGFKELVPYYKNYTASIVTSDGKENIGD